jgi:ribosome biogenesis protein BMS1
VWRNTHPYVVVDRHEDITHPNQVEDDPMCDRSVTFYGYVRGTHLKPGMKIHLIGVGDFSMTEISALPDPCPLPDKDGKKTVSYKFAQSVYRCTWRPMYVEDSIQPELGPFIFNRL